MRPISATLVFPSLRSAYATSSLYALLPTPSSGLHVRAGHYPDYASTMSWSDCHVAILPPCLFSLLEASVGSDTALPSSDANRWMTCHGLRPRPGMTDSPNRLSCCWLPGNETLGPAATMNISGLNTFTCVVADHPPSLWLHVIRCLLTCKVLFWPGG